MKRTVRLASTLAAVLAISLPVAPAMAQQFNWTQVPAMIDVSGRINDSEKQILEEQAAGRLTESKAQELKDALTKIKDLEAQFRVDGKLSIFERMKLILELDNLSKTIQASLTERKVAITDVTGRQDILAKKISDAVVAGQLTTSEAASLNTKLASIKSQEKSMRADGNLTTTETLQLSLAIDQLNSQIESSLRTRVIVDPGLEGKKTEIENKIASLISAGKLTESQAQPLKEELSRIKTKEEAFKASGSELDSSEILTLALELEKLKADVSKYEPTSSQQSFAFKGVDARQDEIKKLIEDSQTSGKLTAIQASEFKNEFDRLEAQEAMYRVDGRLSRREAFRLVRDLDALKKNVNEAVAKSAETSQPSLQERKEALRKKITDAKAANRVEAALADELLAELSRIESKETFYKIDGVMNDTETLIIVRDLDQLSNKLSSNLKQLPNVAERRTKIENQINGALASGRLTAEKAAEIRKDLNRVVFLENTFKGSDGVIQDNEAVALNREYDNVDAKLMALLPQLPDVVQIRSDLNKKVESGAAKGDISATQAVELKKDIARVQDIEKQFQATENSLAEWEVMALKRELDKITEKIKAISEAPADVARKSDDVKIDTSNVAPDTRGHWAEKYIAILQQKGTIGGFPDGSFKPNNGITRAQFAAIATKALDLPPAGRPAKFNDLSQKQWFYKAVSAVSEAGLVGGYPDGTFRPNDKITRTQAFVILSKALKNADNDKKVLSKYKDGKKVPTWAIPSVAKAANAGIVVNYPDAYAIRPGDQATRAEVAALTYQTMANLGKDLPELTIGLEAADDSTN